MTQRSIKPSVRLFVPPILIIAYGKARDHGLKTVTDRLIPPIFARHSAGQTATPTTVPSGAAQPDALPRAAATAQDSTPAVVPLTATWSARLRQLADLLIPPVLMQMYRRARCHGINSVAYLLVPPLLWRAAAAAFHVFRPRAGQPHALARQLSFVDSLKAALPAGMRRSSAYDLIAPYQVDPNARIFWCNGEPYRAVHSARSAFYSHLLDSGVLPTLIDKGLLVRTERTELNITGYDLVLKQRRIQTVSYPFEWCSAMLKDAAVLVLDLETDLRRHGLTLLDPHPWNVLFDGSRPVYVDIGSIVPIEEHPGWPQQDVFRHFFVYPLQLIAGGAHGRVARWLMQGFDSPEILAFMGQIALCLPQNDPNKPAQNAPAADTSSQADTPPDEYDDLVRLRQEIESITFPPRQTEWSSYYGDSPPDLSDTTDWTQKERTVDQVLAEIRPQTVVDIGSNQGWFSKLAVRYGSRVVAFDVDEPSIEALYCEAKAQSLPILPLVLDFVFPTPAFGPGYALYPSAIDRFKSELVLAIALTHHLVFKQRLSFEQIVDGLKLYTRRWLLVEFVPPTDRYVSQWWSEETHSWYTIKNFRAVLEERFANVREYPSAPEPRLMFLCEV